MLQFDTEEEQVKTPPGCWQPYFIHIYTTDSQSLLPESCSFTLAFLKKSVLEFDVRVVQTLQKLIHTHWQHSPLK